MKFDRRTTFKLLGLGAMGRLLPWASTASAQSGEVPLRLLFVELGHGARRGTWEPPVPGPADPESIEVVEEWEFQPVMASLAPFRSRTNLFRNLDMVSVEYDSTEAKSAHINGLTHMLTSASRISDELSGGVSIDQVIAQRLSEAGQATRLRSLEIGANDHSNSWAPVFYHDAYATPGEKLPFLCHVPNIWTHLFPEPVSTDAAVQQRAVAKRTSVYDFVKSDYDRLTGRLSGEDRAKIASMLDSRSALQRSLEVVNSREANRPLETLIDPWRAINEDADGSTGNPRWSTNVDIVSKLVASALHTDTTRVVNYVIDLPPGYQAGYVDGTSYGGVATADWHDLAHKVSGDAPEITDQAAQEAMFAFEKATYDKLADLLTYMDSLPETDGGSLLDHTLVVVHSHIAEGSHDCSRLPWLVIGNAHGALSTGRYVRFPITDANNVNQVGQLVYPDQYLDRIYHYRGRPHSDLFLTIAHAMGVSLESFGTVMPQNQGMITQILA